MESFGKGNGQTSGFKTDTSNRVSKPALPPRPGSTPVPLSRPPAVPNTSPKLSNTPVAGPPPVPASPAPLAAPRPSDTYGIRRAIDLLRRLPRGERGVLVEVVRMTLESVDIQVAAIVEDASNREAEIDRRIAVLRTAVKEREEEISTRREEIANLEVEQKEIARVKQELNAAHKQAEAPKTLDAPSDHEVGAAEDDPGEVTTAIATS